MPVHLKGETKKNYEPPQLCQSRISDVRLRKEKQKKNYEPPQLCQSRISDVRLHFYICFISIEIKQLTSEIKNLLS